MTDAIINNHSTLSDSQTAYDNGCDKMTAGDPTGEEVTSGEYPLIEQLFDEACPEYYTDAEFENDCADHILPEDLTELRDQLSKYIWSERQMKFSNGYNPTAEEIATRGSYFYDHYAKIGMIVTMATKANMEGK